MEAPATKRHQRSDGGEAAAPAAAEGVGPVVGPQTSDGGWRASAAFSLSAVMLGRRKLLLVVMLLLTLHLQSPDKRTREKSLKQNKMIKNDAESRNGLSKLSRNPPRSYFPI